jgi:RNA polymerase sigma-70 factor (ECF subfamily)
MVLEQTDQELVEVCRRGEWEAFRAIFERHKDTVCSIALRYSGDGSAAMDIAQDVFLKLFSCIAGFRGDAGFDSWLFRLVVNPCLDQRRQMRRLMPLMDGLIDAMPHRSRQ